MGSPLPTWGTPDFDFLRPAGSGFGADPDAVAIVSVDEQMSWRALDDASTRLAANYLGLGLAEGDRVASLVPNRLALVVH